MYLIIMSSLIAIIFNGIAGDAYLINFCPVEKGESIPQLQQPLMGPRNGEAYEGRIRVYILEPHSYRWNMYDGEPFQYAFLDFAYDTVISMNYMDTLHKTIIWDGASAGYANIQEENIMAIAAIFNAESHYGFSDPPDGNYFNAYYVDACAAADYQNSWPNQVTENFTHTIFVEKGTATW